MIPRILWHMAGGILKRKLAKPTPGALLHYPGVWKSRAGLLDCSFRATLPENAYFRNMELAIWYGCGLQGILHACAQQRWYFVFGSQGIRHYAPIHAGQAFEVHTQNVYWDDSWFFLLAQFKCPDTGAVFAEGLSRVMLRRGRAAVDSRELYALMGVHGLPHAPAMPRVVEQFLAWDEAAAASMKRAGERNASVAGGGGGGARPALLSAHSMNLPFLAPPVAQDAT